MNASEGGFCLYNLISLPICILSAINVTLLMIYHQNLNSSFVICGYDVSTSHLKESPLFLTFRQFHSLTF